MKVLSVQLTVNQKQSKQERFAVLEQHLLRIEKDGKHPDLLLLPELWNVGFFDYSSYAAWAEAAGGDTEQFLSAWAKRLHCYFLAGSIVERDRRQKLYNTSLFFDREGNILARYRKIHLFGYESEESKLLTAGEEIVTVGTEFGTLGIATCYDLRFPEQFRAMVDKGVTVIAVVSAWPMKRLSHWRLFNQVRALENQSFLISCNVSGAQDGVECAGHSMVVAPDGEILAEADGTEQVVFAEIDEKAAAAYRNSFPALKDRKEFRF